MLQFTKLNHSWDYITIVFSELETWRFANFIYTDSKESAEKLLGWIMLLLSTPKELQNVFKVITSIDFVISNVYDYNNSYIHPYRNYLRQLFDKLAEMEGSENLKFERKILTKYLNYQQQAINSRNQLNTIFKSILSTDLKDNLQLNSMRLSDSDSQISKDVRSDRSDIDQNSEQPVSVSYRNWWYL